jgi:multiple sugar transport system ATP-binding protein
VAEVRVENLIKRFGDVAAVDGITLNIPDGDFMVFLGPSGCGKTTTLRAIAGLEGTDGGDIFIGSRRVNDLPPAARDISFVFQFYALYPHLSVYENVAFPLKAQRVPKKEQQERVLRITSILQIETLLERRINQLASGEQQRVALARAMIRDPQVMLMDEPLTNLDAQLRGDMRAELKHLQHDRGVTTIYVTHDQVEAMAMAHEITVMNSGRIMQVGPPMEIYDYPANLFVAGFLGSPPMNLLPGEVTDGVFQAPGMSVPLNGIAAGAMQARGDALILGIRPEDVRVVPAASEDPEAIQARLYAVEPLGDETILDLDISGAIVQARVGPAERWRMGDVVALTFDAGKIHLFDSSTEEALR